MEKRMKYLMGFQIGSMKVSTSQRATTNMLSVLSELFNFLDPFYTICDDALFLEPEGLLTFLCFLPCQDCQELAMTSYFGEREDEKGITYIETVLSRCIQITTSFYKAAKEHSETEVYKCKLEDFFSFTYNIFHTFHIFISYNQSLSMTCFLVFIHVLTARISTAHALLRKVFQRLEAA